VTAGRQVFKKCQAATRSNRARTWSARRWRESSAEKRSEPDYSYSDAMKSAVVWTAATLDSYLLAPQKMAPGNKMPVPGLNADHDRVDVIPYLSSLQGTI
jgi:nitrite reductase (NO-forming)